MEIIKEFFVALACMSDEVVKGVISTLETVDMLKSARLRAAVKKAEGMEYRRLKAALGYAVDMLCLSVTNIPFMTDEEILTAFIRATPDQRCEFIVNLDDLEGPSGERGRKILDSVQSRLNAEKAEQARQAAEAEAKAKAEAEAQAEKDEAATRQYADEHPEVLIEAGLPLNDTQAIRYISKAPKGRFQTEADALVLIVEVGGAKKVRSMYTGKLIPVSEAHALCMCFVSEEEHVARLRHKLPVRKDGKKNTYHPFDQAGDRKGTLQFLAEADRRRADDLAKEKAFSDAIYEALEPCDTFESLAIAYEKFVGEHLGEDGKMDQDQFLVLSNIAFELEGRIRKDFVQMLRAKFPNVDRMSALESFIAELQKEYNSYSGSDRVRDKKRQKVNVAQKHAEWLKANPKGVRTHEERETNAVSGGSRSGNVVILRPGKTEKDRLTEKEEDARNACRYLKSVNYDSLPESKKVLKGKNDKFLRLEDLSDDQLLSERKRLGGVASKPKSADTSGQKKGKKAG